MTSRNYYLKWFGLLIPVMRLPGTRHSPPLLPPPPPPSPPPPSKPNYACKPAQTSYLLKKGFYGIRVCRGNNTQLSRGELSHCCCSHLAITNAIVIINSTVILTIRNILTLKYIFPVSVCRKRFELGFLIDGSGSIEKAGRGNFKRVLKFVRDMVSSFVISPRYTRVGIVLYSTNVYPIFGFRR